jgi:uncharacterized protein YcbK (DUF882 family)
MRARSRGLVAVVVASVTAVFVTTVTAADGRVSHTAGHADKKDEATAAERATLLATLVDTHSESHLLLDAENPPPERFDALVSDRVTGARHPLDRRLLDLVRTLASRHTAPTAPAGPNPSGGDATGGAVRVELVSGYRSPKLNEMLRKKGHHVASHSQHSLGHALDFRIVLPGAERGLDPRVLEREIRALGWTGGTGVYTGKNDWFVHVDVGPNRRWAER